MQRAGNELTMETLCAVSKVTLETVKQKYSEGLRRVELPVLAKISNLFHHLCSREWGVCGGIEVCLAGGPVARQRPVSALKRLCLSLQVPRTHESPYKSPNGV